MDSILTSIKKLHNIDEFDESFDIDIIFLINSMLIILTQMGVGANTGFTITDKTSLWTDFVPTIHVELIKTFVFLKVKLIFDPPSSTVLIDVMKSSIAESEFRIGVAFDNPEGVKL